MSQDDRQNRSRSFTPAAQPRVTERGQREAEERRARQAQALRANLARRKAQGRAQEADDVAGGKPAEPLENKD